MTSTAFLPVRRFALPAVAAPTAFSTVSATPRTVAGPALAEPSVPTAPGTLHTAAGRTLVTDAAGLQLEVIGRRAPAGPLGIDAAAGDAAVLITDVRDAAGDPLYRICDRLILALDGTWCVVANVGSPRPPVATVQTIVNDSCVALDAA